MKKVVFIGSEAGGHAIQIGIQAGLIQSAYQGSPSVQFVSYPQTLLVDLPLRVAIEHPDVLHLTCHGTEGGIWFSRTHSDPEAADLQSAAQLAQMLNFGGHKVVFIDACHSASIAEFLFAQAHLQVKLALGYVGKISVNASQEGAPALHERLAGGGDLLGSLGGHEVDRACASWLGPGPVLCRSGILDRYAGTATAPAGCPVHERASAASR